MNCRCDEIEELFGSNAQHYAREHLKELDNDSAQWTTQYECEDTGEIWIMDYPESERHGGGSPRLKKVNANRSASESPSSRA